MRVLVARRHVKASPISTASLRRRAERMLLALGLHDAELSLLLCDDRAIHALNRQHRRKNKPTDVLAFAMQEGVPVGASGVLGDVVISLETAKRQADEYRRSLWDEVTLLLAHGLLHLLGYDHRDDAEEAEMTAQATLLVASATSRAANMTPSRVDKRSQGIAKSPRNGPGTKADLRR